MAKEIFSLLFLCTLGLTSVSTAGESKIPEGKILNAYECTAPPPDSFRITSVSSTFISLTWKPAWVGASHTLTVSKKNPLGNWELISIFNNVLGSTLTVDSLDAGKEYQFAMATNCNSGQPSTNLIKTDGITLIVDLMINGRTPINPVVVDCHNIPLNHVWLGFMVGGWDQGIYIQNLFEFQVVQGSGTSNNIISHIQIMRVSPDHPIVAVDPLGAWPTVFDPLLEDVGNPFRIDHLIGNGTNRINIGYVKFNQSPTLPSTIDLCADYDNNQLPWKKFYTITALTADDVIGQITFPESYDQLGSHSLLYSNIKAQSPFDDVLNIFIPQPSSSCGKNIIRLFNTEGQVVMEHYFDASTSQISLPAKTLSSGIYILRIETGGVVQTLKVIKLE